MVFDIVRDASNPDFKKVLPIVKDGAHDTLDFYEQPIAKHIV